MKVKLTELTGEEQSFEWKVTPEWIGQMLSDNAESEGVEEPLFSPDGPFDLDVWLYRTEDDVFFRANLEGHVKSVCVRCLEPVDVPVDVEFGGVFCPKRGAVEDEPDDPSHYFYNGEEINFESALQEHVFLNLPINPTCDPELGTCEGDSLQAQFVNTEGFEEARPTTDSRWDALRQIKDAMEQKKQ